MKTWGKSITGTLNRKNKGLEREANFMNSNYRKKFHAHGAS